MNNDVTRHNRFEVLLQNITRRTNGNIIFREQMEAALISLGGFSVRHVPTMMKAILKKKRSAIMAYYPLFRANLLGAYPDLEIDALWEAIVLSPALVEKGALCNHLYHGEGHSSDCAVCFVIKNNFPSKDHAVLDDGEGFHPGTLEQKTRNLSIDVVLGLLKAAQKYKEEKPLADFKGFPGTFADFRAKVEPISAAGKAALEKTYIKNIPEDDLSISYREANPNGATITFTHHRVNGCTCRDGKDHDLCPACHKHAMKGMNRCACGTCDTCVEKLGNLTADSLARMKKTADMIKQKEDMEAWVKLYQDGVPPGTPIKDYDLHYPPGGERLMRMLAADDEPLLGVPAANSIIAEFGGPPDAVQHVGTHNFRADEVVRTTEEELAQKETLEPETEVCRCNIWAGCTCGVMERERERNKDNELKW